MGGGKGPLIQKNLSATLATNQDQVLFQPIKEQVGIINNIGGQAEYAVIDGVLATLKAGGGTMYSSPEIKVYDARDNGDGKTTNAIVGGHECSISDYTTIIVLATQQGGAEIMINKSPSITVAAGMSGNNQPVICLQGNGIDRADTAKENGKGWNDAGVCYTLNTIDRPAVVFPKTTGALMASGYAKNGTQEAMNGMYVVEKWTTKK